ncbi:MAG: InlB B-repeat-containing protein [Bacteroidales bacterium]|nr:InlB B-repeat-containing protein [Bacteroidales bacterium]
MILYAQWTPCYTITFDANGGEGTMDSLTIVQGEEKELPSNTFTRDGYVFAGWNTKVDGSGTTYNESSKIAPTENMTLYAQWTQRIFYRVIFNANGGNGTMADQVFEAGVSQTLVSNTFIRSGYTFIGWNTAPDGSGTSYTDRQVVILTEDITLYAQWMEFKVESAQINASAAGIYEGGSVLSTGTVLAQSANVTMTVGAEDIYKLTSAVVNDMTRAIVGGASIDLSIACQGSSNPKDADGGNCDANATVPASGAFFTFDVKKDGYLYVVIKASSNKTYLVSEEGCLIGYQFAAHMPGQAWGDILAYTLQGEGEFNIVTDPALLIWPEKIALGEAWEAAAGEAGKIADSGVAVIKFPVFAGCRYTVHSCGSKIVSSGFFLVDAETDVLISDDAGNKVVLYETGVSNTNYYNVTFNANGGSGTMSKQRFK